MVFFSFQTDKVGLRVLTCPSCVCVCRYCVLYMCVCVCVLVNAFAGQTGETSILDKAVPLGDLPAWVLADLLPVGGARGAGTVCSQHQTPHSLVLSGAVKVHNQKFDRDVRQQVGRHVVDEGLVENWILRALLHMSLLLSDALAVVEHVHFHIRV